MIIHFLRQTLIAFNVPNTYRNDKTSGNNATVMKEMFDVNPQKESKRFITVSLVERAYSQKYEWSFAGVEPRSSD